jgi:NAD-dependent SIR2 family protein deacetylase
VLAQRNPKWAQLDAPSAPDGDADLDAALDGRDFTDFDIPACAHCGGLVKPDVVFFGESVPSARSAAALAALAQADAMLVVGSSLMVYSGYRYARAAAKRGLPIVAINLGRTRADALLAAKFEVPCAEALEACAKQKQKAAADNADNF